MALTPKSDEYIADRIEKLGLLKAEIARLEAREKELKDDILEAGVSVFESPHFKATVTRSERETLDMKAVKEHLSPQFIKAHTKVTEVVTLRITERKDA